VDRRKAALDEKLAGYRDQVLTAIGEVEDALTRERRNGDRLEAMRRQLSHARRTLEEAGRRYRKGLNDYLPVLAALESVQRLERSVLLAEYALLVNRVSLHRALGGHSDPVDVID
jgi:outer membrane protein TolC